MAAASTDSWSLDGFIKIVLFPLSGFKEFIDMFARAASMRVPVLDSAYALLIGCESRGCRFN